MTPRDHRLAAIVFTDIVGFSRLMEQDANRTMQFLEYHNDLIVHWAKEHRGHVIKTIGDAFLMDFPTAMDAVNCALAIQSSMRLYNESQPAPMQLRIGIHLGDIYYYENDALGEGINIASRLQSLSQPGTITISREVFNQVSGKIALRVESLGQVNLKNISREIHAYRILPEGQSPDREASVEQVAGPQHVDKKPTWKSVWNEFSDLVLNEIHKELRHERQKTAGNSSSSADTGDAWFSRFREMRLKQIDENARGILGHGISYLGVNLILHSINHSRGGFPWATVTTLGWGIGMTGHLAQVFADRHTKKVLEQVGDLDESQGRWLKKALKKHESIFSQTSSTLMVPALLFFIQNATTGFDIFPWALAATISLVAGWVGGLFSWFSNRKQLKAFLDQHAQQSMVSPEQKTGGLEVPNRFQVFIQNIRRSLQSLGTSSAWPKDMEQVLDQYLEHIGKLTRAEEGMRKILTDLPVNDLEAQRDKIQRRLNDVVSMPLRLEYQKSLDLIEKQKRSRLALEEQHELIEVKLETCEKTLQQIQLDLARILTQGRLEQPQSLALLKKRSDELGNDLLDFSESWKEIETRS